MPKQQIDIGDWVRLEEITCPGFKEMLWSRGWHHIQKPHWELAANDAGGMVVMFGSESRHYSQVDFQ